MEGRWYDSVVDDGLNEAVVVIFGSVAEIHVIKEWAECDSQTGPCEMEYCVIVDEDFAEIVKDKISTDPSQIEEAWEDHLEEYDGSASDTVEIQINYNNPFSNLPGDTFFGNYPILAAIAFGSGVLCCFLVCVFLRIKKSEVRFQSKLDRLEEDNGHPEMEMPEIDQSQMNLLSGDEDLGNPSNPTPEPGQPMRNSMDESKAMEMPLAVAEIDDERKNRHRGESRFEGQTEVLSDLEMQRPAVFTATSGES